MGQRDRDAAAVGRAQREHSCRGGAVRADLLLRPARSRCLLLLLYDGIHYDCLVRRGASNKAAQTLFPLEQDKALKEQCRRLSAELKNRFTAVDDKAGAFQLRCLLYQQGLRHADDARKHAVQTGHHNFGQV